METICSRSATCEAPGPRLPGLLVILRLPTTVYARKWSRRHVTARPTCDRVLLIMQVMCLDDRAEPVKRQLEELLILRRAAHGNAQTAFSSHLISPKTLIIICERWSLHLLPSCLRSPFSSSPTALGTLLGYTSRSRKPSPSWATPWLYLLCLLWVPTRKISHGMLM